MPKYTSSSLHCWGHNELIELVLTLQNKIDSYKQYSARSFELEAVYNLYNKTKDKDLLKILTDTQNHYANLY